jgi:hypothetical protein
MINHAGAPHAFDLFDDSVASGFIFRQFLGLMIFHLWGAG